MDDAQTVEDALDPRRKVFDAVQLSVEPEIFANGQVVVEKCLMGDEPDVFA